MQTRQAYNKYFFFVRVHSTNHSCYINPDLEFGLDTIDSTLNEFVNVYSSLLWVEHSFQLAPTHHLSIYNQLYGICIRAIFILSWSSNLIYLAVKTFLLPTVLTSTVYLCNLISNSQEGKRVQGAKFKALLFKPDMRASPGSWKGRSNIQNVELLLYELYFLYFGVMFPKVSESR